MTVSAVLQQVTLLISLTVAVLSVKVYPDARCPRVDDPEVSVHLSHPTDCGRFLLCSSGMAYELRCPAGLQFSTETMTCDYEHLVGCNEAERATAFKLANKPIFPEASGLDQTSWQENAPVESGFVVSEQPEYKPVQVVVDARCPRSDNPESPVHLPFLDNCGKFWKCSAGFAYEMECPPGLNFDVDNNRCDYPSFARCSRN